MIRRIRKARRARRATRRFQIVAFVLTLVLALFAFDARVGAAAQDAAEYYCQSLCTEAINSAVMQVLEENSGLTKELDEVHYAENGSVQQIEVRADAVNLLRLRLTDAALESLTALENRSVSLRLGSLSGWSLLFGRGPSIPMRVIPLTAVTSEFHESFEGAGVNQTVHTLSVVLSVDMRVLYGVRCGDVHVESEVILSQSLIAGEVPGWYLRN